jgi:MFS transporter, DHA3 family, multidrug efflux protein
MVVPSTMKLFKRLLLNSLLAGVVNTFLWFALIFWVYIETRSVLTTSVAGGAFALFSATFGVLFGTYVDRHRKRRAIMLSTLLSLVGYLAAGAIYVAIPERRLLALGQPWLWLFIVVVLAASMVGNIRNIAMATCVTLLVEEDRRDRANGMVGMVLGVALAVTSVFSGLSIGMLGMGWTIAITIGLTVVVLLHLLTVRIPEDQPEPTEEGASAFDFRGAWGMVRAVPGLFGLILFAAFNNLLGGVFMSLMDAYGLEMVSVRTWGLLWGVLSLAIIAGGAFVSRRGVGPRPLRLILIINLANWISCALFTLRSSIVLLCIGMTVWLVLMPIVEACEQTVLQRVVPFEYQGRVFGFAQTIESSASPAVSLMIGPIAQWVVIPFMTTGSGVDLFGPWFGVGKDRALALIFTTAGVLGIISTMIARQSRWFRRLTPIAHNSEASNVTVGAAPAQ